MKLEETVKVVIFGELNLLIRTPAYQPAEILLGPIPEKFHVCQGCDIGVVGADRPALFFERPGISYRAPVIQG
jgi:hypothetical protein